MEQTHANNLNNYEEGPDGLPTFNKDDFPGEETKQEPEKTQPRVVRSFVDPKRVGMKKDDRPDVLWLVNAEVEHLTPEQVRLQQ